MSISKNSQKTSVYDLITMARNNVKTAKGNISGDGSDIAIVLLANKYNSVFKTTDEILERSAIENKRFSPGEKTEFFSIFDKYEELQNFYKIKPVKNEKENRILKIRTLQSLIYIKTMHQLYALDYKPHATGAAIAAKTKESIRNRAMKIWQENHLGKDEQAVNELKRLYKLQTNKDLNTSIRRIREVWMSGWQHIPH